MNETRIEISGHTFVLAAVAILLTVGAIWAVRELGAVLLLVALSLILASVLVGIAERLERRGVGRTLAAMLSMLGVVLVVGTVVGLVVPPLIKQTESLISNLPELTARFRNTVSEYPALYRAVDQQAESMRSDPSGVLTGVLQFGANMLSVVFSIAMILTLALYFLIDRDRVYASVMRLTPAKYRDRLAETLREFGRVARAYFMGQAIVSGTFATVTFMLLAILGVPYPIVIAALAFFLDAVPNVGATIATILATLIALPESVTSAVIIAIVLLVYQQVENNMIAPRIMAKRLAVPPVLTLLMVLAGGKLLGIVGVFIAIPLAGMLPVIERIWIRGDAPVEPTKTVRDRAA